MALTLEEKIEVWKLAGKGYTPRQIAKWLAHDYRTVRKVLAELWELPAGVVAMLPPQVRALRDDLPRETSTVAPGEWAQREHQRDFAELLGRWQTQLAVPGPRFVYIRS